jgi:hypothetical protein
MYQLLLVLLLFFVSNSAQSCSPYECTSIVHKTFSNPKLGAGNVFKIGVLEQSATGSSTISLVNFAAYQLNNDPYFLPNVSFEVYLSFLYKYEWLCGRAYQLHPTHPPFFLERTSLTTLRYSIVASGRTASLTGTIAMYQLASVDAIIMDQDEDDTLANAEVAAVYSVSWFAN